MSLRVVILVFLGIAGFDDIVSANVIQVPAVHATIQAGINAAAPGDTVQVAPGTYTGPSNRNLDFGGKNIVLRSSAGAATTIIDCQNMARGMRFHNGETLASVVQGFTIRNGLANGTFGGGVLIESGAQPTIRACRFQSNHANTGGGVFVSSGVDLIDCDFEDNSADNYGGGAYGETGDLQATRCTFFQNTAGIGAGISLNFGATATLIDCTFTENDPANRGGGLYSSASTILLHRCNFVENSGKNGAGADLLEGIATLDSCTFMMNTADFGGGGLYSDRTDPLVMTACQFDRNATVTTDPLFDRNGGGAVYLSGQGGLTQPHLADCMFVSNQALGGSAASGGGMRGYTSDPLLERCTFAGNHADGSGGGASAHGKFLNCTFENNTSVLSGGGLQLGYELVDCRFTSNHALSDGGACRPSGGAQMGDPCTILRCEFSENSAGNRGGAVYWTNFQPLMIRDSQFSDNYATNGGGVFAYLHEPTSISGCTYVSNTAALGGALSLTGPTITPPVTVSGSTFVANGAQAAGGINLTIPVQIANTIIAFGVQGEAIGCSGDGIGVMSCTDIFGNAGGNWTACISDQLGINGNFSLDPLFCNRAGRDFTLAQASSCAPAHSPAGCGLIGAHPAACATPIGIADAGAPTVTPMLRVSPNPMRGVGTIEWSGVGGRETEFRLYDVAGRIVARQVESGTGGELQWSALVGAGGVPSGVYFLEMGEGRKTSSRVRLVVVH